jgi:hypothetical protein
LKDYEAEECLGYSEWNEMLLIRNRGTGAYAVAKGYDMQLTGERSEGHLLRQPKHFAQMGFFRYSIIEFRFVPQSTAGSPSATLRKNASYCI